MLLPVRILKHSFPHTLYIGDSNYFHIGIIKHIICRIPSVLVTLRQQKILQMLNLHAVDIACSKPVKHYYIFRVMVFNLKQVSNLPVEFLRQIAAYFAHLAVPSQSQSLSFDFCLYRTHNLFCTTQSRRYFQALRQQI